MTATAEDNLHIAITMADSLTNDFSLLHNIHIHFD